jgi:hypothetical protein
LSKRLNVSMRTGYPYDQAYCYAEDSSSETSVFEGCKIYPSVKLA